MNIEYIKEFIKTNVGKEVVVYNTYGECVEGFFSNADFDEKQNGFEMHCPGFMGNESYFVNPYDVENIVVKGSDARSVIAPRIQKFRITDVQQLKKTLESTRGKGETVSFSDKKNYPLMAGLYVDFTEKGIKLKFVNIHTGSLDDFYVQPENIGFVEIQDTKSITGGNGFWGSVSADNGGAE